ncbi:MAG: hypothetical protein GW778_08365 [Alphaproteobacteria bacterium]|nr:hypothetical protein [Alphaproteobacteria bacterium]
MKEQSKPYYIYFLQTLALAIGLFFVPAVINVITDPYFIYHRPFFNLNPGFDGNDRVQNAGIINSWVADPDENINTLIIGSSMSENMPLHIFENNKDGKAARLTISGGKPVELATIAQHAFEKANIKKVIWEIYTPYWLSDPQAIREDSPLPAFLYNDNKWDDWRYFFNDDVFKDAVKITTGIKNKRKKTLEELYNWKNEEQFQKFSSPENVKKITERLAAVSPISVSSKKDMEEYDFPNIQANLVPIIKNNPQIEFSLFFPPTSYYSYSVRGSAGFWKYMAMREHVMLALQEYPNVAFYGFDLISDIGGDIGNYMDPAHYSPDVSMIIAKSIKNGDHIVTLDNWEHYQAVTMSNVNDFRDNTVH